MKKSFICAFVLLLYVFSTVSCGRTVKLAGENNLFESSSAELSATRLENNTEPVTEAATEPPTEPPTEGAPQPVEIDPDMPENYELKNKAAVPGFQTVMQTPELPTGCEVTALAQTLNYYGFKIDKVDLCDIFMPIDMDGYYSMNDAYLGDPHSYNGFGCNASVIAKTADDYFDYIGSDWYAVDLTGKSLREIFYQIEQGRPVVVWSTIDQHETYAEFQFRLGCGEDLYFNPYQHCLTVYGFSYESGTVHTADPLVGNIEYNMERFERIYNTMNCQAVILCGNEESAGVDYTTAEEKAEWLKKNRPEEPED